MSEAEKNIYEDEKSLGELILDIKDYFLYVLSYWKIIGLVVILFTALFVIISILKPTEYKGEVSFVITESSSSKGGGVMSALSSFGLGGFGQEGVNYDKIISLGKSNRIHTRALLDSAEVNGRVDLLGNHLVDIYELEGEWETITVYTLTQDSLENLSLEERKLLKKLKGIVAGEKNKDRLFNISYDDQSFVLSCSVVSENEEFSKALVESIYEQISNFYVTQTTANAEETVRLLAFRKDSLQSNLERRQVNLATLQDASKGVLYGQYNVDQQNLSREVQVTMAMYLEVVKNLEMARFNLSSIRPFFTIVDAPFEPLDKVEKNWKKQGILGGFIGGFLMVMFIVLRRYINEEVDSASAGRR